MDEYLESPREFTVGQLCMVLETLFDNPEFQSLFLVGEIINKTVRNGHVYVDLADPDDTSMRKPTMKGIIWKSVAERMSLKYEIGDVVRVQGGLNYYQGNSSVSFIIRSMGMLRSKEGKNLLAKRKLLERLDKAGYLDPSRKKPIPRFVERLAIISSPEAAGYHDILNTLSRRYPTAETRLFEAIVQGAGAPSSICKALQEAYDFSPDVIIVARGGGSKSDLSCFDDESVVRMVLKRNCPIITAIGHQIDVSVVDRVADKTAITPTDAANCINPGLDELLAELGYYRSQLSKRLEKSLTDERLLLSECMRLLQAYAPAEKIKKMEMNLISVRERLISSLSSLYQRKKGLLDGYGSVLVQQVEHDYMNARHRLDGYRNMLDSNSVEKTLARGYSFVTIGNRPITTIDKINDGDVMETTMKDGTIVSKVCETRRK